MSPVVTVDWDNETIDIDYELPNGFIWLGSAPKPRNHFEAFVHHVCHGLLMRYPFWSVIAWSWRNRNSFD